MSNECHIMQAEPQRQETKPGIWPGIITFQSQSHVVRYFWVWVKNRSVDGLLGEVDGVTCSTLIIMMCVNTLEGESLVCLAAGVRRFCSKMCQTLQEVNAALQMTIFCILGLKVIYCLLIAISFHQLLWVRHDNIRKALKKWENEYPGRIFNA